MKNQPVIIVKKRRRGHHGHHGGAWKVAYADFVTAMMALFLVMWLVAQSPATRAAVAAYFRDPGVFESSRMETLLDGAASTVGSADGAAGVPADLRQAQAILEVAAEDLRKAIESMPEFKGLKDRIQIELTPDGLRIEMLESATDGFFEVGSSALKPESVKLLALIASRLGRLPNRVAVEGHTDSRPYLSSGVFSNWELSTDRANAARREMQRNGLGPTQVEAVRGYADTKLRLPADALDARNRRISILVRHLTRTSELLDLSGAAARK